MATITHAPTAASVSARSRETRHAGILLILGGSAVLMGIITSEVLYPVPYSAHTSTVSDLAAMRPDNVVRQPSAAIFNLTMIFAGLCIATAAYLLHRAGQARRFTVPVALLGVGMVGVGFVPGNHLAPHQLLAMTSFISGGLGAILTAKMNRGGLGLIHTILGIIALTTLAVAVSLGDWAPVARLGEGGLERWIVYPVVLWIVTLGASLAALKDPDHVGPDH